MKLHAIGFGSLNLDEIWEVPGQMLSNHDLRPGAEYVRSVRWFEEFYPELKAGAVQKKVDPGGSAANTIAALHKMGYSTGFYGSTGSQDLEIMRLHELGRPEDLNIAAVSVPAGRCLALIDQNDPSRDRALIILPNANDMAGQGGFDTDYFLRAEWLHFTSFVSTAPLGVQAELMEKLSGRVRLSFDPGAIYCDLGFAHLEPILRNTEILFTTEEEAKNLTGCGSKKDSAEFLLQMGIRIVIVKHGEHGLEAFHENLVVSQPAIKASAVVDRTGAGDVAAAGFIAGIIEDLTVQESLKLAAAAAARSIEGFGRSSYPDRSFLARLGLRRHRE